MALDLAQRNLLADLGAVAFRLGADTGQWSLHGDPIATWPLVYTWIAACARPKSPDRLLIRWDLTNYGSDRGTGAFWDPGTNDFLNLSRWPKGSAGSIVDSVFKTSGWAAPGKGFYHPIDRQARTGHDAWAQVHLQYELMANHTITEYVYVIHRLLTCDDYVGC